MTGCHLLLLHKIIDWHFAFCSTNVTFYKIATTKKMILKEWNKYDRTGSYISPTLIPITIKRIRFNLLNFWKFYSTLCNGDLHRKHYIALFSALYLIWCFSKLKFSINFKISFLIRCDMGKILLRNYCFRACNFYVFT